MLFKKIFAVNSSPERQNPVWGAKMKRIACFESSNMILLISRVCFYVDTNHKVDEESILHMFCPFSESFWSEVTVLISFCCKQMIDMAESIIFLSDFHSIDGNLEHTVLLLCLLGKFHLHKSRIIHYKPNVFIWYKISFVSKPLNSKASKTFNILESVVRYL